MPEVAISASHNPYQDNGIKLFGADGFKLPNAQQVAIESLILGAQIDRNRPIGTSLGRTERMNDASGRYISFVKTSLHKGLGLDNLKIVVDAAHGAAYQTAPQVFSELGAQIHAIGVKPNGKNINHRVGALHPESCAREVRKRKADFGIALDGDADRVIMIDECGHPVDGDAIMALCATRMLREKKLRRRTLVATVMSNLGLQRAIENDQGKLIRCEVGDRSVVETMKARGSNFGGEQSGHLIFLNHTTTGDGLIAAIQVSAILVREGRSLSELIAETIQRVPQTLISVTLPVRRPLDELPQTSKAIANAEISLGTEGRVLVRWSGTEPKLRVMIEGPEQNLIAEMAQDIAKQAEHELLSIQSE